MSFFRDMIIYFMGERKISDNLPLLSLDYTTPDDYDPTTRADAVYTVRGLASARSRMRAKRLLKANPKQTAIQTARRSRRSRRRESRIKRFIRKVKRII